MEMASSAVYVWARIGDVYLSLSHPIHCMSSFIGLAARKDLQEKLIHEMMNRRNVAEIECQFVDDILVIFLSGKHLGFMCLRGWCAMLAMLSTDVKPEPIISPRVVFCQ